MNFKEDPPVLVANRIQTPDGTILHSYHRHDYKTHLDANGEVYMVDGGFSYLRRSVNKVPAKDLSVWTSDPFEKIREALHWGTRGKDGNQPLRYIPLCEMETDHIKSCLNTQSHMGEVVRKCMMYELQFRDANPK